MSDKAEVHPDGSTTFDSAGAEDGAFFEEAAGAEGSIPPPLEGDKATDPAVYLLGALVAFVVISLVLYIIRKNKKKEDDEDFFTSLDGEKFNVRLPAAVDEYYDMKAKCEEQGWVPGQPVNPANPNPSPQQREMAQALMKRALADIPLVQHIQKEAPGMNKLYSQSMCSVKQWRNYQAAEAMVSAEVEEVRAEADEIEPGWSQVIWRQAMQYHQMLKQKHEHEMKQAADMKAAQDKKNAEAAALKAKEEAKKQEAANAEKAAKELLEEEQRAKDSKSAFSGGTGMKKGFLDGKKKK